MAARVLASLLAFCFSAWPQSAPLPTAQQSPATIVSPVISWHTAGSITVPFQYFQQHIYVSVTINGEPGHTFMLDSGANRNILNLRTARQLGIELPSLDQSSDIGFGADRIYVGPQKSIVAEIESVPVADSVAVLDLSRFEQHFHHPTDGMLGYPFLRRFVVKLDFEKSLLTFIHPEKFRYRGLGVSVCLKPSQNFVEIPVTIISNRYVNRGVNVVIDTGSNVTLLLYERFVRDLGLQYSFQRAQPGEAYGLNGKYPVNIGSIDALQIGDAETRNLSMEYLQDKDEVGPERNLPGAIGNGILQSFRTVIFDVPHRRMIFEITPAPWQPGVQRSASAGP